MCLQIYEKKKYFAAPYVIIDFSRDYSTQFIQIMWIT